MCASLWRRNQVLVLWGCGAETTALAPGLMFCAHWCSCAPYTDPTGSETLEIWLGESSASLEEPSSMELAPAEKSFGRVNKWEKAASGKILLL